MGKKIKLKRRKGRGKRGEQVVSTFIETTKNEFNFDHHYYVDKFINHSYNGTTDIDFAKYIIDIISQDVELLYKHGKLQIFVKNGLISQEVDKDWLIYWIQNGVRDKFSQECLSLLEKEDTLYIDKCQDSGYRKTITKCELNKEVAIFIFERTILQLTFNRWHTGGHTIYFEKTNTLEKIEKIIKCIEIYLKYKSTKF